jgi:hypothetical protein
MRRTSFTLLITCLLGIAAASPIEAQSPSFGPVGVGGRVEVPAAGFAMTLPDDWAYVVPSPEDMDAIKDLIVANVPDAAPTILSALEQAGGYSLLAFAPIDPDSGFAENCNVVATPAQGMSLDVWAAAEAGAISQLGDRLASGPEVTFIDLPFGRAARVDLSLTFPAYESLSSSYLLTDGTSFHVLTCTDVGARPDDDWLSIAETFEFQSDDA